MSRNEEFESGYRGEHSSPDPESGSPMHEVTLNGTYPEDYYSSQGAMYYGDEGGSKRDRRAVGMVKVTRGRPNRPIRAFRAVPKSVKGTGNTQIRPGDWVALDRRYAVEHGQNALNGEFRVLSRLVKAKDLYTNGDSVHEWGYHPSD